MEALGQLTGGLAHDFNNLLTVILGNAEHLAEQLEEHEELRNFAEQTVAAAERGAELTKSLLAFSRQQPLMPKDIDVSRQIAGMEVMLRRALGTHIEWKFMLDRMYGRRPSTRRNWSRRFSIWCSTRATRCPRAAA